MSFGSVSIYTGDDTATDSSGGFTPVTNELDRYATKVSLYNAESSLLGLVLTRASTVSLANTESSLTELVELRASELTTKIDEISSGGGGGGGIVVDNYTEFSFLDGVLSGSTTYSDATKSEELSSKSFIYDSGALSQIVQSESGAVHLTKTITYDSEGNLESITKDYA